MDSGKKMVIWMNCVIETYPFLKKNQLIISKNLEVSDCRVLSRDLIDEKIKI